MVRVRWIRHKRRPNNVRCDDSTVWLVLEQSDSFWIVWANGEGLQLKYKKDYEVVQ